MREPTYCIWTVSRPLNARQVSKLFTARAKTSLATVYTSIYSQKMPKKTNRKSRPVSIEEGLQFLEDIQRLPYELDEPTKPISLRIPQNILRAVKIKARLEKRKYQSLIVEFIRAGLK